jgi:hypothetical protein
MGSFRLDLHSAQDLLADAERYERWAERTKSTPEISERFSRLAAEARARALLYSHQRQHRPDRQISERHHQARHQDNEL